MKKPIIHPKTGVKPFSHHRLVMSFQSHLHSSITIQTDRMEDGELLSEYLRQLRPDVDDRKKRTSTLNGYATDRCWVWLLLSIYSGFKKPLTLSSANRRFKSQAGSWTNRKDPLMVLVQHQEEGTRGAQLIFIHPSSKQFSLTGSWLGSLEPIPGAFRQESVITGQTTSKTNNY